jgi:hypothetical protein
MTLLQISRNVAGAVALLALTAAVNAASAADKLVGTYGEVRTILAFKVPDTTLQKMLPDGWQVSPMNAGPSKDANVTVSFIDWLTVQNPDGTPGDTVLLAALAIPAKKKGTDATVPMVATGFASKPDYVPGPYGAFALASATVDRHVHTDPAGTSNVEESWEFKADGGDVIQLQLQYVRGVATRSKVEALPHSAIKPDFYRIYQIEQAADVVRSISTGTDRAQKYLFKATGGKLSQIFDGSEQLISITSLPWYSRQVFLPEQFTQ